MFDIGGGVPDGKAPKAIHFGGAMGGSIPIDMIDAPLDFDGMSKLGAPIGAGRVRFEAGRIVAMAQREFRQIYPRPGWVEHDALDPAHRRIQQAILVGTNGQ